MELRRVRGTDAQADPRGRAGLADLPRWMSGRRGARTSGCACGPGDRPVARGRRPHRAIRARTCAARARGALDRVARERGSTLSAEYGHPVCARLLPRNTGCADLERAVIRTDQKAGTVRTLETRTVWLRLDQVL